MTKVLTMTKVLSLIDQLERRILHEKETFLTINGWTTSSNLPGSYWLWSKSFPASNVQWHWEGGKKVMNGPFIINGTTLDIALVIETAWQDLYWRKEPKDSSHA